MKTVFLVLVLFIIGSFGTTIAQTEQGRLFLQGSSQLGANVKFDEEYEPNQGTRKYRFTEVNFNPMIGYVVTDYLILGLSANVAVMRRNYIDSDDINKGYYSAAGPFIRFYLVDLKGFQPMLETGVMMGRRHYKYRFTFSQDLVEYETKSMVTEFWAGTGGTYFLTDFLGLDFLFGYALDAYRYKDNENKWQKTSNFFFKAGIVITLGKGD